MNKEGQQRGEQKGTVPNGTAVVLEAAAVLKCWVGRTRVAPRRPCLVFPDDGIDLRVRASVS